MLSGYNESPDQPAHGAIRSAIRCPLTSTISTNTEDSDQTVQICRVMYIRSLHMKLGSFQ